MKRSLIVLMLLGSTVALAAWRLYTTRPKSASVWTAVKPFVGYLQIAVTATGTLYPSHSVDIKFDGQEIVERLTVKEGDHVSTGQVLAVMDTRVVEHTRLENLQTTEKDSASLIQAEAAFHRGDALFKEGIVARSDFEVTRATYESLVHQRQADDEAVKETAQQMERAVLRSPMNGTVITIYVHSGEMLGSATAVAALGPNTSISKPTNVLMTLVEDGPLEVYAGVNAADLGTLAAGQEAGISIDAFQPRVFHGRVRRISLEPVVVNNVTTYQAIVTLTDGDPRFRIGLAADVMLLKNIATRRQIVPAKTVFTSGGQEAICTLQTGSSPSNSAPAAWKPVITQIGIAVELTTGRFFSPDEDERAAKVAVLGETVRQYLFGNSEALDRRVRIGGIDFRVIGVLTPRGDSPGLGPGMSTDDRVFIPLCALDKRMLGSTTLRLITISSRSPDVIPLAAEETRALLAKRHPNNPFEIRTQTELMQTSNSVSGIVNLLLTSLAGVSLAVGGIGIMNIMLVAVSERTREIGVRRAVGADRASILSQFLLESILLGLAGGMISVFLAIATSMIAGLALRWHTPILPGSIAIALLSATMVGILSGIYPARQASRLNVVDALRFE